VKYRRIMSPTVSLDKDLQSRAEKSTINSATQDGAGGRVEETIIDTKTTVSDINDTNVTAGDSTTRSQSLCTQKQQQDSIVKPSIKDSPTNQIDKKDSHHHHRHHTDSKTSNTSSDIKTTRDCKQHTHKNSSNKNSNSKNSNSSGKNNDTENTQNSHKRSDHQRNRGGGSRDHHRRSSKDNRKDDRRRSNPSNQMDRQEKRRRLSSVDQDDEGSNDTRRKASHSVGRERDHDRDRDRSVSRERSNRSREVVRRRSRGDRG